MTPEMRPSFSRTRCNPDQPKQATIADLKAHSYIDERNAQLLKLFDYRPLSGTPINADEDKTHARQFDDVIFCEIVRVGYDPPMHGGVDVPQIVDLKGSILKLGERSGSGSTKRIVLKELVSIEEVNFFDRRLRDEI